jgi:uncharacterized protein involved in outer membrane biogenesis
VQFRGFLAAAAVLVGLALILLIGIALVPDSLWKHWIAGMLSRETRRAAYIDGDVKVRLFRLAPSVSIDGLRLQNASWADKEPMVSVRHFEATVRLSSLLRLKPVFPSVRIESPRIDLERDASDRANWDFSSPGAAKPQPAGPSKPTRLPAIQQLVLTDGALTATDAIRKLRFNGRVSIASQAQNSKQTAMNVSGTGTLNGKPFELRITGGPLVQVDVDKPYRFDATVRAADIDLTAQTEIRRAFDFGSLTSTFHVSGKDLADLYYLTELALPNTPPYDVKGTLVRDGLKFHIQDLQGRLGRSDIDGKVTVDTDRKRPKLTAELNSKLLNMADLAAPLGTQATAESKSGTLAEANGAKEAVNPRSKPEKRARPAVSAADRQSQETGYLLPDADLQIKRIRAMDAEVRFEAATIRTEKIPLTKVRFHLVLDNGRLTLSPLEFTMREGQFSGEVSLDARQSVPVTDIDMSLKNLNLAQFKPKGDESPPLEGEMLGRIHLQGRGSSLHKAASNADGDVTFVIPDGEMRAAFAELTGINLDKGLILLTKKDQSTQIRCGVASFHAADGDLKANSLLIDTTHVLVTGEGHVNLKDEALNLSLRGQAKEMRLVRLRSPILIHGTLAHPEIGLKPGPLAGQAGAAVALGTLLTPVAAVLAFVDKRLAKDANCTAILAQADTTSR